MRRLAPRTTKHLHGASYRGPHAGASVNRSDVETALAVTRLGNWFEFTP